MATLVLYTDAAADPATTGSNTSSPVIMRQFTTFPYTRDWTFDFAPREVTFDNISAEIAEISRVGRYPLASWRNPKLTHVGFEFRVADRESGGRVPVDLRLRALRDMSLSKSPTWFVGFDDLISYQSQYWYNVISAWFISSFSMKVVTRDTNNHILVADCAMSLVEIRNPSVPTAVLPIVVYPVDPPKTAATSGTSGDGTSGTPPATDDGEGCDWSCV